MGTALITSSLLPLNLHMIARLLPNVVYDCQKFAAITIRLHSPMCTSLLFTSGKMASPVAPCRAADRPAARDLIKVPEREFQLQMLSRLFSR